MTAHRHVERCFTYSLDDDDPLLICGQTGWAREDLELRPPDAPAPSYANDLEPERSAAVIGCGCLAISVVIVLGLLVWLSGALAAPRPAVVAIPAVAQGQAGARVGAASGNPPRLTGAPHGLLGVTTTAPGGAPPTSSRIRLADPTRGVIAVSIERLGATPTLPPTDTAP